jgi:hypothetical protein
MVELVLQVRPASVFYVTEPSDLDMRPIDMGDYSLKIAYSLPDS